MTETRDMAERYSAATQASRLKVEPTRGDVDYLIAAGYAKDDMGAALFRLATEWDMAGAEYRMALRHSRRTELEAGVMRRNAARIGDVQALIEADAMLERSRGAAMVAKALAMVHLKTLGEAKRRVHGFAWELANKLGFMEPDEKVYELAGKALQLWLDATCPACNGTRAIGVLGAPRNPCTVCGATGRSHHNLSKTDRHSAFIRSVLAAMDAKCHRVQQQMSRWLRQTE